MAGMLLAMPMVAMSAGSAQASDGPNLTDKICNSSGSKSDIYVSLYLGPSVGTKIYPTGPGDCVKTNVVSFNYERHVLLPAGSGGAASHRVGYNYGPYSSCRQSPSGYFQPANNQTIYFKAFPYSTNCTR